MKIALLALGYHKRGGISRYVAELAERYAKQHEVHIFSSWLETRIPQGAVHHHVPTIRQSLFSLTATYTLHSSLALRKQKFDIVHNPWTDCLTQDVYTAQSCHRAYFERVERFNGLKSIVDPTHRLILAIEDYIYTKRRYKRIISVSEGVKKEIIRYYGIPPRDITVIPNGVDLERFKPGAGIGARVRKSLGLASDDFVLLFVAHEFKRKGLAYIIRAIGLLHDPKVKLLVVGGDNKNPYAALEKDTKTLGQVIFLGSSSKVEEYYKAADIFVFPTAYEAFSLAAVEAMAAGLPLLATKVNGTEELVKDGENGFFIARDPRDIAAKVRVLFDDRRLRIRMGKAARKTAGKYSWNAIAEKTLAVYKDILR